MYDWLWQPALRRCLFGNGGGARIPAVFGREVFGESVGD
jgi:hypothetical protein